jgi:tRNA G18 (ribose-2'-O)-methylase SpoU
LIERLARLDDPRVAAYAYVADAAWLRDRGLFVAEGRLVVQRLVQDRRLAIESILITPSAAAALEPVLSKAGCPVYICAQDELAALSGINFHRGCLALAHRPPTQPLDSFGSGRLLLGLERLADPDNVGSVFRNALAFGVDGVMLDSASADPLYRKAIRTSMAATLRLPFTRLDRWPGGIGTLRDVGFTIIALTPDPLAMDINDLTVTRPERMVLLFGSEGDGLSREALDIADLHVRIPIDPRGDSLNVGVAAGIALHRLGSRNKQ